MSQVYYIEPVAKPRMTQRDRWKKRPCVERYWAYRDLVKTFDIQLPAPARVTFYVPMPKSWSKKKKLAHMGRPHTQKPDIDNYLKGFLDAIYEDDSHVWSIWAQKIWREEPGIKVEAL